MHILSRSCSTDFYQSYGPLTIFQQLVLSPQLLLQFSRDFDETFQLLFPRPEDMHIISRSHLTTFYQSYGPLTVLAIFINRSSCLRNSSYSFQGIFMKLSRYCCHDLKMRIFYRGHARLIFYQSYGPLIIFQQ